jgi:hypothetical protein
LPDCAFAILAPNFTKLELTASADGTAFTAATLGVSAAVRWRANSTELLNMAKFVEGVRK